MLKYSFAFALLSLPVAALAAPPVIFEATSADKASGFRSMAECEAALGRVTRQSGTANFHRSALRGSVFNRKAGNISRCELIAGAPMMVVYPASHKARPAR